MRYWTKTSLIALTAIFSIASIYFISQIGSEDIENVIDEIAISDEGTPISIKIPKINLETSVEYVGLTREGAMDTPKNQKNVAWYSPGAKPGEIGTAVFAGHYGWKDFRASAFDNLHKLEVGDKVHVETNSGELITFVVKNIKSYDPYEDSRDVFVSDDGKAHLNLITCQGIWDKILKSYSKRLVVFTEKI